MNPQRIVSHLAVSSSLHNETAAGIVQDPDPEEAKKLIEDNTLTDEDCSPEGAD